MTDEKGLKDVKQKIVEGKQAFKQKKKLLRLKMSV